MKQSPLRGFTYAVLAYLFLAFVWWSVLLFTKNRDALLAKTELLKIGMVAEGIIKEETEFYAHPRYQALKKQYDRQEYMIIGESVVLILSVLGGIYIIYSAFKGEMRSAQQQRNFLLSITHELKSPIAGIRLVLETLLKRELRPEQIQRLGDNALKEVDRLTTLVEDLLLSARLETAYQPHIQPLDLDELLHDSFQRVAAKHTDFNWQYHSADHIPMLRADKTGLVSVATNLLENAAKYSNPPAKITLSLHSLDNQAVEIRVTDEGIGIDPGEKRHIFDKFYRVGNEDTRKTKGAGLGLFIVREIVRAHQGKIKVMDNQPQGTIFSITLPLLPAPEQIATAY